MEVMASLETAERPHERAEKAQRMGRVEHLLQEVFQVHDDMEKCIIATEQDLSGLPREDGKVTLVDAQRILRRSKIALRTLLRREENILSLYAAECGHDIPRHRKNENLEPFRSPRRSPGRSPNYSGGEQRDISPAENTPWEVRVLQKIRSKLLEKRGVYPVSTRRKAKNEDALAKIESQLDVLKGMQSQTSSFQTPVPQDRPQKTPVTEWSVSPVTEQESSMDADLSQATDAMQSPESKAPVKSFDEIVSKISSGRKTPARQRKESQEDLLEMIATPSSIVKSHKFQVFKRRDSDDI